MTYPPHPLADLLPTMDDGAFEDLVESIQRNGQLVPITLHDGMVLDGRHRLRACELLGIAPQVETYEGSEPAAEVLALNVSRRHLTTSQRAMLATRFLPALAAEGKEAMAAAGAASAPGRPSEKVCSIEQTFRDPIRARVDAARRVGVGHATVGRAKRVAETAPDLAERVTNGEMTVHAAEREAASRRVRMDAQAVDAPRKASAPSLETTRGQQVAQKNLRLLQHVHATLEGTARGLTEIDLDSAAAVAAPDELAEIVRGLEASTAALRRFANETKKRSTT